MPRKSIPPLRGLSLGAGVQSSTLAILMARGDIEPCDHAIFADTGGEPQVVYDYLDYLIDLLPFPVHVVSAPGGALHDQVLDALKDPKNRCSNPPFMVRNKESGKAARLWRKCTLDHKILPIRRKLRELKAPRQKVLQAIGISTDEAHRAKPSQVKYIKNIFPLIDLGWSRFHCLEFLRDNGYRLPPKSACWFCPYMDNKRLRSMRDGMPNEWQKLVAFDHKIRELQKKTLNAARITGEIFIHRDCKPIDEVNLGLEQIDLFGEECEGMCGL